MLSHVTESSLPKASMRKLSVVLTIILAFLAAVPAWAQAAQGAPTRVVQFGSRPPSGRSTSKGSFGALHGPAAAPPPSPGRAPSQAAPFSETLGNVGVGR